MFFVKANLFIRARTTHAWLNLHGFGSLNVAVVYARVEVRARDSAYEVSPTYLL